MSKHKPTPNEQWQREFFRALIETPREEPAPDSSAAWQTILRLDPRRRKNREELRQAWLAVLWHALANENAKSERGAVRELRRLGIRMVLLRRGPNVQGLRIVFEETKRRR